MSSNKAGSLKNIFSRNISENKSEYRLKESLAPYALQIIGMTFILPVVLARSALLQLKSEAITALLGAIIGYIFGSAGTSTSKDDRTSSPSDQQIGERAVQPPVHISWFWAGRPGANQTIGTHTFDTMTTLPTGLAGSHGTAGVAATNPASFSIQKNGMTIGTMNFLAGWTRANFTMEPVTTFTNGDVLTIVAPAEPDQTLANLEWTIVGMVLMETASPQSQIRAS